MDPDHSRISSLEEIKIQLPIAELGTRGLAQVVDFIILLLIWSASIPIIMFPVSVVSSTMAWIIFMIVFFLTYWGFFVFFEMIGNGQSPGKKLIGLRVVNERGGRLTWTSSLIRNFIRWIDFLPMFYGFGVFAMFLTSRTQRLGDLAAGTIVIREEKESDLHEGVYRRYPRNFTPEEIRLVERVLENSFLLIPERKLPVIQAFYEFLEKKHPEIFLGHDVPENLEGRIHFMYRLFPPLKEDHAEL